jgi:hypothetical protein
LDGSNALTPDSTPAPDVVYHYTHATGLLGIVQSGTLWATDAEFMNDAQELRFGRGEMHSALSSAADKLSPPGTDRGGPDDTRATIMRSAADHLDPGGLFLRKEAHAAYLVCFCETGDLLSQWRAYGSSGGFAVGFRTKDLESMQPPVTNARRDELDAAPEQLRPAPDRVRLVKVSYGPDAIQPVIDHVLQHIAPRPRGHPGVTGFFRAKALVLPALATIKHATFAEEKEWRVIAMGSVGEVTVRFRAEPLGVIPYMALAYPSSAITEIVVGPGPHPEVRKLGAERLLANQGLGHIEVRLSESPLRG